MVRDEQQETGPSTYRPQGRREPAVHSVLHNMYPHVDRSGDPHRLGVKVRQPEARTKGVDFPAQFSCIPAHELMCMSSKYLLSAYSLLEATVLRSGNAQMKSWSPAIHGVPDPTTLICLLFFRGKMSNILL